MNLYEAIKKHSELTLDDFKEYKRNVLDIFEQYEEDMLNDDSDVFSGTEDSYANEMLAQRLSEYLFDLFCSVIDKNKANKYANFCTGKIIEAYFDDSKDQNEILRTFATYKDFHDKGLKESEGILNESVYIIKQYAGQFGVYNICEWEADSPEQAISEFLDMNPSYKDGHYGTIRAELKGKELEDAEITKDDLIADAKRDLNIEPGSDEEYELDNLYALRDLDKWIEDLYDDGESREEIKNKFAIEDIALHYGMSDEELDSKVDEVCNKVDKLWSEHEKFMQSLRNKNEADGVEVHTMDNDPSWAAAINKVNKEYSKNKSKISDDIAKEYVRFTKKLTSSGLFKPEDVWELPEGKAYRDAIKDPEDIWCDCDSDSGSKFKPDGSSYLGVSKHGYICNKCKKFTQIG